MKEALIDIVRNAANPLQGRNLAREYLQARILVAMQRSGAMIPLAFHGGTALRFLFAHDRYSEDLDFALERRNDLYDFTAYLNAIRSELIPQGYKIELKANQSHTVHSAFIRFAGLPYDLGLSPHQNEIFAVKIEVDTNPPAGAHLETTVIRRGILLQLQHHDKASLLAGKLHAILQRPFLKGRDIYDLIWYLSDPTWPPPNLGMLNNALQQTGWSGEPVNKDNWRRVVQERFANADWGQIVAEVMPFLENENAASFLTAETLSRLLWK